MTEIIKLIAWLTFAMPDWAYWAIVAVLWCALAFCVWRFVQALEGEP